MPGLPDSLIVSLEPFDQGLADRLGVDGIYAVRAGSPGIEACVRREGSLLHLGDEIYGDGRDPLVSFSAEEPGLPEAVIGHYARHRHILRLCQRCLDLPGALKLKLLDCRNMPKLALESLQAPRLPQLPIDPNWGYKIREGDGFAICIDNRAQENLNVFMLNYSGSGRVEYLGDVGIQTDSRQVVWRGGILGKPFYPAAGVDKEFVIDRLVLVGTTLPDRDLRFLASDSSFAECILRDTAAERRFAPNLPTEKRTAESIREDAAIGTRSVPNLPSEKKTPKPAESIRRSREAWIPSEPTPPVERWTAEMVTLRIYK